MTDLSTQQKKVDKVIVEYKYIFSSLTMVTFHSHDKNPIDLTPNASLPNGPVYLHSMLDNEEIK
jgi:hypothetical protein